MSKLTSIFDNLPDYDPVEETIENTLTEPNSFSDLFVFNNDDQSIIELLDHPEQRNDLIYPSSCFDTRPLVWFHPNRCQELNIPEVDLHINISLDPIFFYGKHADDLNTALLEAGFSRAISLLEPLINENHPIVFRDARTQIRAISCQLLKVDDTKMQRTNLYYNDLLVPKECYCAFIRFEVSSSVYGSYQAKVLFLNLENSNAIVELGCRSYFNPEYLMVTNPGWANSYYHRYIGNIENWIMATNQNFKPKYMVDDSGLLSIPEGPQEDRLNIIHHLDRLAIQSPSIFKIDYNENI